MTAGLTVEHVVYRQATTTAIKGAAIRESDLSVTSLSRIFSASSSDLIISTTSGGDYELQQRIIDCAIETGVQRFMPAEFGHDSLNEQLQRRLPPLKERARTVEYLRQLSTQGRIEWVAVATGTNLDHGITSGNLGFDLKWQSATLHGRGDERFAASSISRVGQAVFAVIQHWNEVRGQYLYASGLMTSANDVLEALEEATGKKWEAGRGEVEDCVREAEQRIDRGFPDDGMFLMERSVLYDESLDAVRPFVLHDAKPLLGLKPERLGDVVKTAIHQHDHHGNGGCGCD